VETYRGKLILYGCGEFIDDYEGITGYEAFRADLRLLYLVSLEPDTGRLLDLRMMPMQARRMRLQHASAVERGVAGHAGEHVLGRQRHGGDEGARQQRTAFRRPSRGFWHWQPAAPGTSVTSGRAMFGDRGKRVRGRRWPSARPAAMSTTGPSRSTWLVRCTSSTVSSVPRIGWHRCVRIVAAGFLGTGCRPMG
jgi:hypothetical protein